MESTPEYRASLAVWRYCPPLLFVFGTFGNVMTMVILRRMPMKRSAMPVYLTALAVSDTCLLYTGLLRRWVQYVFHVDVRSLAPASCKIHTWLVYSLVIVSPWLLSVMTLERFLSVWRPHRVSILCTRTKAAAVVVAVVAVSLLVNAHLLYGVNLMAVEVGGGAEGGGNGSRVMVCSAPEDYLYFFDAVWSWVDLTLASLLPFTLLLVGNCLILCKMSRSTRSARHLHASVRPHDLVRRRRRTSSMTMTLIMLSIVFFLTTSPICVYNIIEHYVKDDNDPRGTGRLRLAWAVVNILMYTNSCVNFYLYCLSGTRFRQELRRCLCCCLEPPWSAPRNVDVHTITKNGSHHRHRHNGHRHDFGDGEGGRGFSRYPTFDQNQRDHHHHHHHHHHHYRYKLYSRGGGGRRCCYCLQQRGGVEEVDVPDGVSLTFHSRVLTSALADAASNDNDNSTEF